MFAGYTDTSFLVSLYSPDATSAAAVRALKASAGERFVTILGELELRNAFGLRVFRKEVTEPQAQSSLSERLSTQREGVVTIKIIPSQHVAGIPVMEVGSFCDVCIVISGVSGLNSCSAFQFHEQEGSAVYS